MASPKQIRVNQKIQSDPVRVIGQDGEQVGILPLNEALNRAKANHMDLVEIAPMSSPPVCRIMDFGKFRFEQSKKKQASRKKQKQTQIKEVKFRPNTDVADYQVKLRNIRRFLADGDKVKLTLRFRGREMAHQDLGLALMRRIEQDLIDESTVEQQPKSEGRLMIMVIAPIKHNKKK